MSRPTDSGYTDFLYTGDLINGPEQVEYEVEALDAATSISARFHPTMTGQSSSSRPRAARSMTLHPVSPPS
jgi:hypothetical protein